MNAKTNIAALALALVASPLAAQITVRNDGSRTGTSGTARTGTTARERIEEARDRAAAARAGIDIGNSRTSSSSRVPPGHLPPRGLCRVWIDGVPPGHQPPVTDCATAERNRVANSRVIYGDRESFKGKGKYKKAQRTSNARQCSIWDGVVVDGRVVNVCRDDTVFDGRQSRTSRDGVFRGDDKDDDRWKGSQKSSKKFEKQAQKSSKQFEKSAKKGNRGK